MDSTVYDLLKYYFLRQVEESGNLKLSPYLDTKGIPSIGLGLNMRDHAVRIMEELGINPSSANAVERAYAARIKAAIDRGHSTCGPQKWIVASGLASFCNYGMIPAC